MKKNNGRRKADGRRKNGRRQAPSTSLARAQPATPAVPTRQHTPAARPAATKSGLARHVDWPALAILVLPLAVMALLHSHRIDPLSTFARPAPWHGDIMREAMPLQPDPVSRVAIAPPLPTPTPWRGDITREAMPLQPDPTSRVAIAPPLPTPAPWRGDLMREAMPLQPDPASRVAFAPPLPTPAPWSGDISREAMPLQPDPASRAPAPTVVASPLPLCLPDEEPPQSASTALPASFGHTIAAAAREQINDFVIYNERYVSLSYPGGDTASLYGVCTDVVVRAYRALGIDFQELIHASRLGRGDRSIDHRRVEVVRRFLARHGTSLAISEFAEDYRPGDIVTYHRPEGRISQSHIAIVSDRIAPSGRPLIAHNRGWGTQLEDALFVDRITGHYRLSPEQVEAFHRTRAPRAGERRRRTAESATATRR